MNYKQLLEFLGIENASEFEYFENFSDLMECDEEVSEEALYKLFDEANKDVVLEIIENYFEEIMDAIPDDSTDIYTLFETIKMALIGLLESSDEEVAFVHFCEELNNFRTWYCIESKVECKNIDTLEKSIISLRDALSLSRIERLEGDKYHYDFDECLDYTLEEYIMSYGDMARNLREEKEEDNFEESYDDIDENIYDR